MPYLGVPMKSQPYPSPTIGQRLLRNLGRIGLPKIEGLYEKLGLLRDLKQQTFECDFKGLRYRGRLDQRIDQHVYYFGAYSPSELDFLARAAAVLTLHRSDITFVDIGANVGQHTLFMSGRVSKVLAFEPGEEAADQLAS